MTTRQKIIAKISEQQAEIVQHKIDYNNARSWVGRNTAKENIEECEKLIKKYKELL